MELYKKENVFILFFIIYDKIIKNFIVRKNTQFGVHGLGMDWQNSGGAGEISIRVLLKIPRVISNRFGNN